MNDEDALHPPEQDPSEPDPTQPDPPGEPGPGHDPTGLDLARSLARSARGRRPVSGSTRRTPGPGRRGAERGGDRGARRGGVEPTGSGAHPDDRDPQTADATLARLVAEQGWASDLRAHGVFARWPEVVGADVAAHSRPESFTDGTLVVGTDSTAWATQLRLLAPALLRRLNSELGHGTVLVIDVRGPQVPSWTRGRRSVRGGRGPRDTYG